MSFSTERQKCAPSTRLPTVEETVRLQQRRANVADAKYGDSNLVCPYLVGRLAIEPWIDFDDRVQQATSIVKEMLVKDDSALHSVRCALGRAWTAVDRDSLASSYDVARLFPAVFDVLRSMLQIVDKKLPSLSCAERVLLPPHGVRKPQALPAMNCVMIDAKDWNARTPCLCVSSAWPTICLYSGKKNIGPLLPRCAQAVSERWNSVLADAADPADLSKSQHQLWIIQAVTEALYSHSGCAVLWNYRSMVSLRVVGFSTGTDGTPDKVRVEVSSMYTDGQVENAMFGLISTLQVALNSALSAAKSESLQLYREILGKSTHCLVWTDKSLFSTGPLKWLSNSLNVEVDPDERAEEYCWISSRAAALFASECGEHVDSASLAVKFFDHVLSKYSRVMYAGNDSSVLLLGSVGHVPFITKYANINMTDGSDMLWTEADIYNLMRKNHMELLGSCVPDVLAIRTQPRCDPVIVIEFVGQSVTRDGDGRVMVGGAPVSQLDWMQILSAANRGLDSLASAGLSQGDETIANIRAERVMKDAPCEHGSERRTEEAWRAWWIDFGLAKKRNSSRKVKDKWYEVDASISRESTYFDDL